MHGSAEEVVLEGLGSVHAVELCDLHETVAEGDEEAKIGVGRRREGVREEGGSWVFGERKRQGGLGGGTRERGGREGREEVGGRRREGRREGGE